MATPLSFQTTNNFSHQIHDGKLLYVPDLTGTVPIFQGQIAVFDATLNGGNGGIRPAASQADMTTFVGIAEQNSILNSLGDQLPTVRVGFKNIYFMNTTAAEVYKFGTVVFFNEAVPQVVGILPANTPYGQVTASTNAGARTHAVGYVILPNQTMLAGITSVTGAVNVQIPVAVVAQFPVPGLA